MDWAERMAEYGGVLGIEELKVDGLLQCWRKEATGRWLVILIDIFNFWFDDEPVPDIAIIDYETWPIKALEYMPDEEKGSDGIEYVRTD